MSGKKYEDKMNIDMPFKEALERYIGADPEEMRANIEKSKSKKPPGDRKRGPRSGSKGSGDQNVVRLGNRRKPNKP